jgi:hypothetical protein
MCMTASARVWDMDRATWLAIPSFAVFEKRAHSTVAEEKVWTGRTLASPDRWLASGCATGSGAA